MIQIAELFTEQQCLIHLNEYNNQITYMFRDIHKYYGKSNRFHDPCLFTI